MSKSTLERTRTILIADDDEESLSSLCSWLEQEGYKVISASDGEEALRRAEIESPDLILMDLAIPQIDGYALLLRLKGGGRTGRIPVFVLSDASGKEHRDLCQVFGAMEYLEKPLSATDVASKISRALG